MGKLRIGALIATGVFALGFSSTAWATSGGDDNPGNVWVGTALGPLAGPGATTGGRANSPNGSVNMGAVTTTTIGAVKTSIGAVRTRRAKTHKRHRRVRHKRHHKLHKGHVKTVTVHVPTFAG